MRNATTKAQGVTERRISVVINTKAIKIRMIEKDISNLDLANAIGKKPVTVRQKISGHRPMFLAEAEVIQEVLDIPDDKFCHYFFSGKSQNATKA